MQDAQPREGTRAASPMSQLQASVRVFSRPDSLDHVIQRRPAMARMSRRVFLGALPFVGTGLSTLVRAEVVAPSAATLFQNVRIFDGKASGLTAPSNVLVKRNVIERISTAPIAAEAGSIVIAGG